MPIGANLPGAGANSTGGYSGGGRSGGSTGGSGGGRRSTGGRSSDILTGGVSGVNLRAAEALGFTALTPEQDEYQRRLKAAGLLLDSQGALI